MSFFPSANVSFTSTGIGQALSASRSRKWRHPWQTAVAWHPPSAQWFAQIEPGFVNGAAPIVRTTIEEQASADKDFGRNPLTGNRYFSDPIFTHNQREASRREIAVPLYLSPAIPLRWRAVGFDGGANSAVPEFFKSRGAADAPAQADPFAPTPDAPRGLRLLRACDLILHQPRQALTSHIEQLDGIATGVSFARQTLSIRPQTPGDVLRIFAGTYQPPAGVVDGIAGGIFGLYEEETWDEVLLSRVFVLSPPGADLGSEPDGTWQVFVQHDPLEKGIAFWNLSYAQPHLHILESDPGTPFIPPLAAGAAQVVINGLTAAINDLTTQALNILTAHSLAGTFWVATGGGSRAEIPEILKPPKPYGLDKGARLLAERIAAAVAKRAQKLDPDFPYRAAPFNPDLLAA